MKKYFAMQRQIGLIITIMAVLLALGRGIDLNSVLSAVIGLTMMFSKELVLFTRKEIEWLESEEL